MSNFNTDDNFWVVHPELRCAGPFKKLYNSDKSRNKANSSKVAWAVKLIWDRKSMFYPLPEEGPDNKVDLVFEDFYGDKYYFKKNQEKVEELRDFYYLTTETVARRTLRGIEEKLLERDRFLRKTPYDEGTEDDEIFDIGDWAKRIETIDKMMERTQKIYDLYDKAVKTVEREEEQTTMGGAEESLTDSGEI